LPLSYAICLGYHITFHTHDASEPDLEALLLGGAYHPVKGYIIQHKPIDLYPPSNNLDT
jgi:hypothetical protein